MVIQVEKLSKTYRLGSISGGTLRDDAARLWAKLRKKPDPTLQIGVEDQTHKKGREFKALKDVSFEVKEGEILGIIGRNGAGKSTLLKILSRVTAPTSGEVRVKGRIASLLEVGTGFHPELTGREDIFLNGAILGMSKHEIRNRFDEIVAFSGVERFIDTPVKRYSSGMYVRLAFAVAAHLESEILIVDEVLAVGDAEFQKTCLGKMKDVAGHGRTVLFVSHNMTAIDMLCPTSLLLADGKVSHVGSTSDVLPHYLSDAQRSNSGEYDLLDHPARLMQYKPIIRGLKIKRLTAESVSTVYPEEKICVEIHMLIDGIINEPRIAIAIEDSLGRRLMTFATFFQNEKFETIAGEQIILCYLESLDLGVGTYFLSVSIGTKVSGLLDSVDGAASFEVEWNNNYKTREPYHAVYGPLLKPSTWHLKQ